LNKSNKKRKIINKTILIYQLSNLLDNKIKNFRSPTDAENRKIIEAKKNFNRLLNNINSVCAKSCFKNMRSDRLSDDENLCMTNCQQKYYDVYDIGDKLNMLLDKGEIKINFSSDKSISNIVDQMNNKINI